MSIRQRIENERGNQGVFAVVGGLRLDGKTTLAGTLPGKTLLLQAYLLESGAESAQTLANELGNDLDIIDFNSFGDLMEILEDPELLDYDNIYVDGVSAVNELRFRAEDMQRMAKKDIWGMYRVLGTDLDNFILKAKKIALSEGKNVFVTLAYKAKLDASGNVTMLEPDVKGNKTTASIQRLCPVVLASTYRFDEDGNIIREVLTKSNDVYPARIGGLLDEQNPGRVPADLSEVLKLIKESK